MKYFLEIGTTLLLISGVVTGGPVWAAIAILFVFVVLPVGLLIKLGTHFANKPKPKPVLYLFSHGECLMEFYTRKQIHGKG